MSKPDFEAWMSEMIQHHHILEWYKEHYPEQHGRLLFKSLILTEPLGYFEMLYRDAVVDRGLPFPTIEDLRVIRDEDDRYHTALSRGSAIGHTEEGDIWRCVTSEGTSYWRVERIYRTPRELPTGSMFYTQEDMPLVSLVQILGSNKGRRDHPREETLKAQPCWSHWPHEYLHKLPMKVNGSEFVNPYEVE